MDEYDDFGPTDEQEINWKEENDYVHEGEGEEDEEYRMCAYCMTLQPDTLPAEHGNICAGCLFHVGGDVLIQEPEDGMDGDHESALTSAGYGTDEDYGYYGGGEEE